MSGVNAPVRRRLRWNRHGTVFFQNPSRHLSYGLREGRLQHARQDLELAHSRFLTILTLDTPMDRRGAVLEEDEVRGCERSGSAQRQLPIDPFPSPTATAGFEPAQNGPSTGNEAVPTRSDASGHGTVTILRTGHRHSPPRTAGPQLSLQ